MDHSQTYALYLPKGYPAARSYPCIYFFDAHARGSLPVRIYKDIAERYGFVLVGSNNSQNGAAWPETNELVKTMMEDSRGRINIDPKRVYTSGFSGGSRVAASVAIFNGGIAGVIGCAAGFPQVQQAIQRKFDYVGIAGNHDFNFSEMAQLDNTLEQNGFQHQLITSNGMHGWPNAADLETAVLWLQINAIKEHLQPANETLVGAIKRDYDNRIAAAMAAKDWITAHDLAAGAVRVLNGVGDVSIFRKQLAEMETAGYKDAVARQAKLAQAEQEQQQEVQSQFAGQNDKWLSEKIKQLNKSAEHAGTPQEAQMNGRVLSYLEFVAYMYTDHALKAGDPASASKYLAIFKQAGPKNPDGGYLKAICSIQKGDHAGAIAALNEAASLGYDEVAKLIKDPAFSSVANDEGFKRIVQLVRENYTSRRVSDLH